MYCYICEKLTTMTNLVINKEMIYAFTEIFKYTIPLFAALSASYLTYRFSKKDKIRDHLFTYKVKSYSDLAHVVLEIQKDLITLNNSFRFSARLPSDLAPMEILSKLTIARSENILFISEKTKRDLHILEDKIRQIINKEELIQSNINNNPTTDVPDRYKEAYIACDNFIENLQSDLEMHRIGTKKR